MDERIVDVILAGCGIYQPGPNIWIVVHLEAALEVVFRRAEAVCEMEGGRRIQGGSVGTQNSSARARARNPIAGVGVRLQIAVHREASSRRTSQRCARWRRRACGGRIVEAGCRGQAGGLACGGQAQGSPDEIVGEYVPSR